MNNNKFNKGKIKKGERIMIGSGEDSCSIKFGLTKEEEEIIRADKIDNIMYCKPVALVKKITRRIKK